MLSSRKFQAVIQPDLPPANTWPGLIKKSVSTNSKRKTEVEIGVRDEKIPGHTGIVQTCAVQTKSKWQLKKIIQDNYEDCRSTCGREEVQALLCVSGGHPVRQLPLMDRLLPSSCDLLTAANELKQNGLLPDRLDLWAVENPLLPLNQRRMVRKAEAGASTLVTQPPLLKDHFGRWWEACDKLGLLENVNMRVGVPIITSTNNLRFWFAICGVDKEEKAQALLQTFREREESLPKEAFDRFCDTFTQDMISFSKELPQVSGLHFMPVTKRGYSKILDVLE